MQNDSQDNSTTTHTSQNARPSRWQLFHAAKVAITQAGNPAPQSSRPAKWQLYHAAGIGIQSEPEDKEKSK